MARVTVDEEVWTKFFNISNRLGWKKREVSGLIVDLWHNSQRDGIATASRDEIVECCELWNEDDGEIDKVIDCLVWQKILTKESEDTYTITGNQKHIDGINTKRRNGKKASKKKVEPKEEISEAKTETSQPKEDESEDLGTLETDLGTREMDLGKPDRNLGLPLHYIPLQNITKQDNTIHSTSSPPDRGKVNYTPNDLIQLWNKLVPEKQWSGISFGGGKHQEHFLKSSGYPELCDLEGWKRAILKALESEWLTNTGPLSLTWLLNYDNVLDVLGGKYLNASTTNSKSSSGEKFDYTKLSKGTGT